MKNIEWRFISFLGHFHFILEMLTNLSYRIYKPTDRNDIDKCLCDKAIWYSFFAHQSYLKILFRVN